MKNNTTLRCLIVEDEELPAELLKGYIAQVPFLTLAGHCTDALYAMEWLRQNTADVIFLDIHLPQLRGLDFLSLIPDPPLVIFTTAYDQYALDGYRFDPVDYLLKPYGFARFYEAIEKLRRRIQPSPELAEQAYLLFKVNKQQVRIKWADIIYIESQKEYAKIYISDRKIITQVSLQALETTLPSGHFLRIHRSFIVNIDKITAFSASTVELSDLTLPIGKTYVAAVMDLLNNC